MHFRSLDHDKMEALKWNGGDYEPKMILSPECLEELSWWVANVDSCVRKITCEEPHSILETDASLIGWGAKQGEMKSVSILIAWSYFQYIGYYCLSVTQNKRSIYVLRVIM